MIHDVKVFNPKGELTGIINAQRLHDAKYLEIARLSNIKPNITCSKITRMSNICLNNTKGGGSIQFNAILIK